MMGHLFLRLFLHFMGIPMCVYVYIYVCVCARIVCVYAYVYVCAYVYNYMNGIC